MTDALPQGWTSICLAELVSARKGKKPGATKPGPSRGFVPYLDIRAIERDEISSYAEAASSRLGSIDDIFVVWDGARSGWVGLGREGAIGSTIMALMPVAGNRSYIYRWLQSQFEQINTNTRGTGIPHVDPDVFWNLEVPFAPLAEQRRIVAKLETLLGKVDACQQRLAKIPVLFKRFRQSVLAAACSGRLTEDWREERTTDDTDDTDTAASVKSVVRAPGGELPHPWQTAEFGEFIQSSFYGPRFSKDSYSSKGVPTVRTTDMGFDGSIVLEDSPCLSLSSKDLEKFRLKGGDLVVTRTGATIGKCAVFDDALGPAIPSAYLIRFRLKRAAVDPKFALRFLMSPAGQQLLVGGSTAVAQPNVNAKTISRFVIPVPPLAEQQEIVRRVEALFALADRVEARFQKAQAQVDKLTTSILAKAFRGQLVPQDPNDEPAEKLLQRIRDGMHARMLVCPMPRTTTSGF